MNSPFIIEKTKDNYKVTWPAIHDIHGNDSCYNLLRVLFVDMKVESAKVFLTSMDNMMTVSADIWYNRRAQQYSDWLMSQYSIVGVLFDDISNAEKLQEILEKRYMWKILKS